MFSFTHNDILYSIEVPAYPVNLIVDHFVYMNGNGQQIPERLFPNNQAEMFFNLGDRITGKNHWDASTPEIKYNIISGVRHTYFDFYPPHNFKMAGMRFTLFGFGQLFKMPAYEFTDSNFSATDVFGIEMRILNERLYEAKETNQLFSILNEWICTRLSACSLQEIIMWNKLGKIFHEHHVPVAEQINKYMGYSHKHSIELIKHYSGLSPKEIKHIYHFNKTLKEISAIQSPTWVDFACENKYADQSHFIREFKRYTGYTPKQYFALKPREYQFNKVQPSGL